MNLKPIILLTDYQMLRELIKRNQNSELSKDAENLSNELDRAIVIQKEEINKNIIRINSEVEFEEVKSKKVMKFKIVLPEFSNLKEGKISILAPLGTALIGFSQHDSITWKMPSGETQLKVLNVFNENIED